MTENLLKNKSGRLQKGLILLGISLFVLLIFLSINSAQNETENPEVVNSSGIITNNQESNASPNENNESLQPSQEEIIPSTEGNLTNITEEITNETTLLPSGQSINETETNSSLESSFVDFNIEILSPEKITRGERININSTVTNIGNIKADKVVLTWQLPSGFELIENNLIRDCGEILPNEFCISEITIKSSLSSNLGKNKIKILVNYENQ